MQISDEANRRAAAAQRHTARLSCAEQFDTPAVQVHADFFYWLFGELRMVRIAHALRLLITTILLSVAVPGLAVAQAPGEIFTYRGACDGSAAVALDQDRFVVADDDSNVLNIFQIGKPDARALNLDQFLEAPLKKKQPGTDGQPAFKEADIEGAARIDDRIYWIGSHGRDSDGDAEPGRARLFATRILSDAAGPRLEPVNSVAYKSLREDMLGDENLKPLKLAEAYAPDKKKNGPPPESDNGFNIEGLAATPDGRLLIGFRNPRPANNALVIRLDNPAEVVDGKKPVFGKTWQLETLEGRGIRSIDRINSTYVIVAGPHLDAEDSNIKPPFALYTWSGQEGDNKPARMKDVVLPAGFNPEAVFAIAGNVMLLSDDGSKACKKADRSGKSFRAITLPAPK
ncbi:hypothetical protein CO669_17660 [Bradyrhizobium sp. Y36]|uniref:DUF3616 domain-containing protein n=1 Tax=Bradyrhizobium sp. Y36 TaxID=2035447 RepID=UPI000BE80ED4|nr:DUF3616 domain-containing protein [Bradyrhizobium sp. Y36]PDT88959.1 hypothetical protein CO669_17660 [Bradyrhizobium sp. Y36]